MKLAVNRLLLEMQDSPGKRLAAFRRSLNLSQRQFGAKLGTSNATVGFIETDQRTPSKDFLVSISDVYGINADWLLNGHGEKLRFPGQGFSARLGRIEPPIREQPGHGDVRFNGTDFAFVRRMDLSVSAGSGLMPVENGESEMVALPMAWFSREGINSDLAVLVSVKGDSMTPAIPDGALVLVHLAEKMPAKAGVYAFNLNGESFIKRILPSGADPKGRPVTLLLVSDNPSYGPLALSGEGLNSVAIIGRVRCVLSMV